MVARQERGATVIHRVLERAMELMREAVMVIEDRSGSMRIVYVNGGFTRMTRYSYDEVVGARPLASLGRYIDLATLEDVRRRLEEEGSFDGRMIGRRKDGTPFLVHGHVEPLGMNQLLVIMRGTPDQRSAGPLSPSRSVPCPKRLVSRSTEARVADDLEEFLSRICSELSELDNALEVALTLMQTGFIVSPSSPAWGYVDRALGEVECIRQLLRSLDCVSLWSGSPVRVELSAILHEIVALIEPRALRSGVALEVEPPPVVDVIADSWAIHQIMINLLSNALETARNPTGATVRLETRVEAEYVDISVTDNGPGMTCKDMAMAMRPYSNTRSGWDGIALTHAQHLATEQGGHLQLHSELGEGTRVVVSLLRAPTRPGLSPAIMPTPQPGGSTETISMIGDER